MTTYDVILVLGTSTDKSLFKARVEKAVELYTQKVSTKIIFSGKYWGGLEVKPTHTEARLMSEYAISLGVSPKDIYLDEKSLNTIGNFYFTKKDILEPNNLKSIVVITHAAHLEKVTYLAHKILGPKYQLEFLIDSAVSESGLIHKGVADIEKFFVGIADGEDEKVSELLKVHPFYTK